MEHPEIAHPHDMLVRHFLTYPELMADLLRFYPQKSADKKTVELLDLKHLVCKTPVVVDEQLKEHIGDLRFSTMFKGSKRPSNVFLLFEHQSTIDPDFRFRGLEYIVKSFREFRTATKGKKKFPYPIVVVLYHGKIPWKQLKEMDEMIEMVPGAETGLLKYTLILIDVSIIPPEQFKGHPLLQVVLELLQLASTGRLIQEFDRVIARLVAIKNDPRIKGWSDTLTRYVVTVAKIGTEIGVKQIIKAFSTILNKKEIDDMAKTIAEQWMEQGEARSKDKWKAEAGREMVLEALRTKFKRVPKDVEKAVLAMSDPIALKSLLAQAIESATMGEFAEALR